MVRSFAAGALALALSLPALAHAGIVNQPGRFRVDLPPDFKVLKHGRAREAGVYFLAAQSSHGNVKLYIRSAPHPDPTIDLGKHMAYWANAVRRRGVYTALRPVTRPYRDHALMTQFFTATGRRVRTVQPYTVYVGVTLDRSTKRVYTFSVASQSSFFHKNKKRLVALARTFRPYHGEAVVQGRPLRRGKRVSLRGRLVKQRSGLVTSRGR